MTARLIGLGVATPSTVADQRQATKLALSATLADPAQRALVEGLYKRAGVERRGSAILRSTTGAELPLDQDFFPVLGPGAHVIDVPPASLLPAADGAWPSTSARMAAFALHAGALAQRAALAALQQAGVDAAAVTHLITVSCTGLQAPGVDVELVRALGLRADVQRVNIGFMGCHGAIVALRTGAALAHGGSACVLAVCVELCTLHLQRTDRADQHVANALFGDGAAAMVVRGERAPSERPVGAVRGTQDAAAPGLAAERPLGGSPGEADMKGDRLGDGDSETLSWCVRSSSSMLFAESAGAMGWRIGDHGFEMTLDRGVPAVLEAKLGDWIWPWLRRELGSGVRASDLDWVVHPGGPRILDAVERGLGLSGGRSDGNGQGRGDGLADPLGLSREVLREHGNMSSATVLLILQRLWSRGSNRGSGADAAVLPPGRGRFRPTVLLAFGPGLTGEAALLTDPLAPDGG